MASILLFLFVWKIWSCRHRAYWVSYICTFKLDPVPKGLRSYLSIIHPNLWFFVLLTVYKESRRDKVIINLAQPLFFIHPKGWQILAVKGFGYFPLNCHDYYNTSNIRIKFSTIIASVLKDVRIDFSWSKLTAVLSY